MTNQTKTSAFQFLYYAIIDELSTLEDPAGVLRRVRNDEGPTDEAEAGRLGARIRERAARGEYDCG